MSSTFAITDMDAGEPAIDAPARPPTVVSDRDSVVRQRGATLAPEPAFDADAQAEVTALDQLWERDWLVDAGRAYGPQRVDTPQFPEPSVSARRMRRVLDVAVASAALVLAAPIMLVLATAVKLSSPGPVIFKQNRIGAGGGEFQMRKFRSMSDGTERQVLGDDEDRRRYVQNGFKLDGDDPRITRLGRFMRKTSLDELPQLLNVLHGEMSVVGVRPLVAPEIAMRPVHDQLLIKMMRPGLTGLWQVEGRSAVEEDDRFALDRRYVEQWSVWSDIRILLRTPLALTRVGNSR